MIYLDKTSKTPYYLQIYKQLLSQILSGQLPAGHLLPGCRTLAADLGVGRNTVDHAYSQLVVEGYLSPKTGCGFQVQAIPELLLDQAAPIPLPSVPPAKEPPILYDLVYGSLSNREFPFSQWRKEMNAVLTQESQHPANDYPDHKGDLFLRTQLSKYLFETRGILCSPEQVIITAGLQGSLEILCKLFLPKGGLHIFENPSYDKSRFIFQSYGLPLAYLPLDKWGAIPSALPTGTKIASIYLTPSHQFPLGMIMPIQRRYAFLNAALEQDAYLIEDDYDSEYSYYGAPVPALQSIDTNGRVIYLGSFSKSLPPSMRMAYLILPPALAQRYDTDLANYNSMVPWLMQRTLARFIANGHYRRLVRRLRTKFKRFHDLVLKELCQLSPELQVVSQGHALKFLLSFPPHMHRDWLTAQALKQGVKIYSPERFWHPKEACPPTLIQIGFTAMEPEDVLPCIQRLKTAWFPAMPEDNPLEK